MTNQFDELTGRFIYPTNKNFDAIKLKDEIGTAGLLIKQVHIGNGCLVFEFYREITEEEKTILATVIYKHNPNIPGIQREVA